MHACFVIGAMNYSGAEKVLSIIMKELVQRGNEVSVILLEREYGISECIDGIHVFGAKACGNKIQRIRQRRALIRRCIREINSDIVISFGFVCNINVLAAVPFSRIPILVCERNDPLFDPRKKIQIVQRNLLYRLADGYVFQTKKIGEYFSEISHRKSTFIVPNPIVDSGVRWSIEAAEKRVVTFARLDDFQKDQLVMIRAFQKFHFTHSDYILEIYGAGPDKKKYQQFITDNQLESCIMLKGKSHNPLHDMKNAGAFLLTSRFEGMPNALMEAMSIGIPFVTTDCSGGGAHALMEYSGLGRYILPPVGDVDSIANALCRLIDDKQMQLELSQKGVKINQVLSEEKVTDIWERVLTEMIEQ